MPRPRSSSAWWQVPLAATLCTAFLSIAGCGPAQNRAVSLKPLEERRARAIIERAIIDNGETPVRPRVVEVSGKELTEDMAIEGGTYGVAYITREEDKALAGAIPARDPEATELRLVRGAKGEVVLVVWEQNYRFDESSEHTATAVTAERKLARDVSDFVLHVVKQGKGK
ncbi:MAG TPA: hypothetical protein ENK57_21040 [Polyangiaceae bacterium]|nr:hypothetical protein [Polyangiaceae bacterium]